MIYRTFKDKELSLLGFGAMRLPMNEDGTVDEKQTKEMVTYAIENGVIEGRQDPPGCGFGSYLVSEGVYGDFELILEAKPDWPADTGIYLRASDEGSIGYHLRPGLHYLSREDWQKFILFANRKN